MDKPRGILAMDGCYLKQVMSYLGSMEIVRLAMASKAVRNKIRAVILKDVDLEYSDAKYRISKNFFQILRNMYNKKIIKLTPDNFKLLLREPKSKEIQFDMKSFYSGKRIVDLKFGPKLVGTRTDNGQVFLLPVASYDELNIESPKIIYSIVRFEVCGWCVLERESGILAFLTYTKETKYSEIQDFPVLESKGKLAAWSSCFDRVVIAYKMNALNEEYWLHALTLGKFDAEPLKMHYTGPLAQLSMIKNKVQILDKAGDLHIWDISTDAPEFTRLANTRIKKIYTNSVLSLLYARNNNMPKLEEMDNAQLLDWMDYINLSYFHDVIKYSKTDGKAMAGFTRDDYQNLMGFPTDSPEVNHFVLHNRLLSLPYYKNPILAANGYNGNNELGINTGNNMVVDLQDFTIPLDDFEDDIAEVRINGTCSFIKTAKDRKFACIEFEEKNAKNQGGNQEELSDELEIDSDDLGETKEKAKKKLQPKRKGSKTTTKNKGQKFQDRKHKKFEKLKWKEITDCLEKCPKLSRYIIDTVECTKSNVFIICHEKPVSFQMPGEREHLLLTGDAVLRVLNDPKLSKYEFDVGLKHS